MSFLTHISIQEVQTLLEDLEAGDLISAGGQLDRLTQLRNHELYEELGRMTRNLHETLKSVEDIDLMQQVKHDLPDLNERLDYVLTSTEQASAETLAASEQIQQLFDQFSQFKTNLSESESEEFERLISEANSLLSNIAMAQSFQDLTGQVLNRIKIVISTFERSLLDLISRSGHDLSKIPKRDNTNPLQDELKGIGPNVTKSAKKDSVQSQDEVDDLLSQLGF